MRNLLLLLILIAVVVGAIYYFAPWQRWSVPGFFHASSVSVVTGGTTHASSSAPVAQVLGAQTVKNAANAVQKFVSSSGQVLGAAASNLLGGALTNAENSVKEVVVQQIANLLGVSTTVSSATPAGQAGFGVCSVHHKDETISYLLELPASTSDKGAASSTTEYTVDWGDGQTTHNSSAAGAHSVLVAHAYSTSGIYTATFHAANSNTVLAQKEVCVQ